MQIHPNRTTIEGKILAVRKSATGWGADVEVEVQQNVTAAPQQDFIQAKQGARLVFFAAKPDVLSEGKNMRLQLTLLGGPQGQRVVVEKAEEI